MIPRLNHIAAAVSITFELTFFLPTHSSHSEQVATLRFDEEKWIDSNTQWLASTVRYAQAKTWFFTISLDCPLLQESL